MVGTNTAYFDIPNSSRQIVATAMPSGSSLIIMSSFGLGVLSSGQDGNPAFNRQFQRQVDNSLAAKESLDFTLTAGVQSSFRLAAVEFTATGPADQFILIAVPSQFSATADVTNLNLLNPYAHCVLPAGLGPNGYDCFDVLLSGIPGSVLPSRLSFVGDISEGQYGFAGQNGDPMSGTEFLVGTPLNQSNDGWFIRSLVLEMPEPVPEPTTLVLFGVGFVALRLGRRRLPAKAL
jgi:hypothetical protein